MCKEVEWLPRELVGIHYQQLISLIRAISCSAETHEFQFQERIIQAICEAFVDALGFAEAGTMIEVVLNDRLGKKVRVKCNQDDTIGELKKLVAAQTGTRPEKIRIQKWYTIYKDHITLGDYEIHDGMGLELYYN